VELRQDRMTHEERMNALSNYQKPDRVPFQGAGGDCTIHGYTLTELQTDPQKAWNAIRWASEMFGTDPTRAGQGHTILAAWDFGGKVKMPDSPYSQAIAIEENPVKTGDDVWNLKLPDPKTAGGIPKRMEFSQIKHRDKPTWPIAFFTRSPFTAAANIPGVDLFARWIIRKPKLCEHLMEMVLEHTFNVLKYFADTFGAENLAVMMSSPTESNQVMSPRIIEKYALPYHKEYHRRLRALGAGQGVHPFYFHICGEQNLNLPILSKFAASGEGWHHPAILSFGHEVDLEDAARYFPDDIIYGNVEPAPFQTGPPELVYKHCRRCIEKGKKFPGGFILGPGCGMPPRAPSYNVWMMTKAVNDFGWYD